MDHQRSLFHESLGDALGSAVQAIGGRKKAAAALWPHIKPEVGYARVSSCLSHDKHDKFSLDEIVALTRLARESGDHSVMQYLADDLGYRIEPVTPREEMTDALALFESKADDLIKAISAVQRAQIRKVV